MIFRVLKKTKNHIPTHLSQISFSFSLSCSDVASVRRAIRRIEFQRDVQSREHQRVLGNLTILSKKRSQTCQIDASRHTSSNLSSLNRINCRVDPWPTLCVSWRRAALEHIHTNCNYVRVPTSSSSSLRTWLHCMGSLFSHDRGHKSGLSGAQGELLYRYLWRMPIDPIRLYYTVIQRMDRWRRRRDCTHQQYLSRTDAATFSDHRPHP